MSTNMKTNFYTRHRQRGFNLMEVLIAIAVFAIGMLALGALQGALTRTGADARARAEAVVMAESLIEAQRAFRALTGTANFDYDEITSTTFIHPVTLNDVDVPLSAAGFAFGASQVVTDYCYDVTTDAFSTTCPVGQAVPDVKTVAVTVTWEGIDFDDAGSRLGSGTVTLTSIIPAVVSSASGKVAKEDGSELKAPPVVYTPGQNPDVVALSLGENKFKESLVPVPDVVRTDQFVETTFDVITYSTCDTNVNPNCTVGESEFLRREEFRTVSCECNLEPSQTTARTPTLWGGDEYIEGEFVTKSYGTSSNNQQSDLCDTCCRDHHDVSGYPSYRPFSPNHNHYTASLQIAGAGDEYLEVCRMVRVDGFWRVTADFRREDEFIFPADYLDDDAEIAYYSSYVTDATEAFAKGAVTLGASYPATMPCIGEPDCDPDGDGTDEVPAWQGPYDTAIVTVDGAVTQLPSWTQLPVGSCTTGIGIPICTYESSQQLRSRGLYIDYLSPDLRTVVNCLNGGSPSVETCQSGDVILDRTGTLNVLEVLPFFDVQRTFLDRWTETPNSDPLDVSNEALASGNTHSRGLATRAATPTDSESIIEARSHRGNVGFTDTPPMDTNDAADRKVEEIDVCVFNLDGTGTCGGVSPPAATIVTGTISESVQGNPDIIVSGTTANVLCDQTSAAWECRIIDVSMTATILVSGYGYNPRNDSDAGRNRYACAPTLTKLSQLTLNEAAQATFDLSDLDLAGGTGLTGHAITIQSTSCPTTGT